MSSAPKDYGYKHQRKYQAKLALAGYRRLTINLSPDDHARLILAAQTHGNSKQETVVQAIRSIPQ